MLYAYLLTRTEFKIETEPDLSAADKKFAYSSYIDLLILLLELTGHSAPGVNGTSGAILDKKLTASAVGKALASDSSVKELILKGNLQEEFSDSFVQILHDEIVETSVFKEYKRKRKNELEDEVKMWAILFETTIANNANVIKAFRKLPGFTKVGFQMAVDKIIRTLNSFYDSKAGYYQALRNLEISLKQAHKLYISMFVLIVRLTQAREQQLENARHKYLATAEDRNPNTRFVENSLAVALASNKELENYVKEYGISWTDDITLLDSLLASITSSEIYKDYMSAPSTDWEADCELWRQLFKNVIFHSDDLAEALESTSVYWNDDLHIIGTFVLKSLRVDMHNPEGEIEFLPQYKDEEDSRFGAELFEFAVKNRDEYYSYIEKYVDSSSWDSERIAFMDTVIMICAIAEIINFPNVPIAVSLNEYIDIANLYSSPKSGHFINGLLYNVVEELKSKGIIFKS